MITPESRKKKPAPARTRPVRSMSKLLRQSQKPRAAERTHGPGSLIEQTVRTGYDLVEEYLSAGRAAAEGLRQQRARHATPEDEATTESEPLAERMAEYSTHLAMAGLEFLQALSRPAHPARPPTGSAPPFASLRREREATHANGDVSRHVHRDAHRDHHDHQAPTAHVSQQAIDTKKSTRVIQVQITAQMPVQVTVEMTGKVGRAGVTAQAVRRTRPREGNTLERGITLQVSTTRGVPKLQVRVAKSVRPGSYRSVLVRNDDNVPCGFVKLQVPVRRVS